MKLGDLFFAARGYKPGLVPIISRRALTEKALDLPGCPDNLDPQHLHRLETNKLPPNGLHLRYYAAAAGLHLIKCFRALDYWPPVGWEQDPMQGFQELCDALGLKVTNRIGNRFVVEVPKEIER